LFSYLAFSLLAVFFPFSGAILWLHLVKTLSFCLIENEKYAVGKPTVQLRKKNGIPNVKGEDTCIGGVLLIL
jgi:hypothetical protein